MQIKIFPIIRSKYLICFLLLLYSCCSVFEQWSICCLQTFPSILHLLNHLDHLDPSAPFVLQIR